MRHLQHRAATEALEYPRNITRPGLSSQGRLHGDTFHR
jgi:hypothetical protein